MTEHSGVVLRRLSGRTENAAPVVTLVTQFGGGKTHTLTLLYHLANAGREAGRDCLAWSDLCLTRASLKLQTPVWESLQETLGTPQKDERRPG